MPSLPLLTSFCWPLWNYCVLQWHHGQQKEPVRAVGGTLEINISESVGFLADFKETFLTCHMVGCSGFTALGPYRSLLQTILKHTFVHPCTVPQLSAVLAHTQTLGWRVKTISVPQVVPWIIISPIIKGLAHLHSQDIGCKQTIDLGWRLHPIKHFAKPLGFRMQTRICQS